MINEHTSGIKYLVLSILASSFFIVSCDAFAASYSIIYDDNVVSNMPTDVNDKTFGTTVTVTSTIPTRPGYNNIGWCSVIPKYLNGVDTCTGGTQYDASDDLTIDQTGSSNNFHLYAMWQELPCASSQYIMQNVSQWKSSVTSGNEVTACDNRDGKTYTVARLADNNLWMTQNLDFDIVNGGAAINSINTDVPSNWADGGNLANTHATSDTTWSSTVTGNTIPQSYDPGDLCWDGTIASSGSVLTTCTDRHYHIGNYYSWTAAVAMANSSSYTTNNTDVDQSICPAGWTLPKSGSDTSSGSFAYLVSQASIISGTSGNIHTSPYYYVYGGYWEGGSHDVGGNGSYWSPTVHHSLYAYDLYFNHNGSLRPDDHYNRYDGYSVRCVAR